MIYSPSPWTHSPINRRHESVFESDVAGRNYPVTFFLPQGSKFSGGRRPRKSAFPPRTRSSVVIGQRPTCAFAKWVDFCSRHETIEFLSVQHPLLPNRKKTALVAALYDLNPVDQFNHDSQFSRIGSLFMLILDSAGEIRPTSCRTR